MAHFTAEHLVKAGEAKDVQGMNEVCRGFGEPPPAKKDVVFLLVSLETNSKRLASTKDRPDFHP